MKKFNFNKYQEEGATAQMPKAGMSGWALQPDKVNTIIQKIDELKKEAAHVIGDPTFFDFLDGAVSRIKQLKRWREGKEIKESHITFIQNFIPIEKFKPGTERNLSSQKMNDYRVLFNYKTPILAIKDGNAFLNTDKYSVTTSVVQTQIKDTLKTYPAFKVSFVNEDQMRKLLLRKG